jgi:hypothetical protein
VFGEILDGDRNTAMGMYLNAISPSTTLATLGNSWMIPYQGGGDASSGGNNVLDSYQATSATSGTALVLTNTNSTTITAGTYLVKTGDYVRPQLHRYPYIATADVVIPTAASGITGTITAAGVTVRSQPATATTAGYNVSFVTTTTRTTITGITSTTGLSVGQILTRTSGSGAFGTLTYIDAIIDSTSIIIQSTTACTAGSITFTGTGPTSTPTVVVPIHRGFIGTLSTNTSLFLGARAGSFVVKVSSLPQIRYLPGQLVELTGDLELVEEIL